MNYEINSKHSKPCCNDHDEPCGACEDQQAQLVLYDFHLSKLEVAFWNLGDTSSLYSQYT